MKNYQRVNYRKYYAQDENGNYVEVDRKTCFATAELPTEDNPYKQRWFYDEEAGYVIRLSRTKQSEDIHRFNSTSLKREERYRNGKFACIYKDTNKCSQECNRCDYKNTSRTVELDKNWSNDNDEMDSFFTPADDYPQIIKKDTFDAVQLERKKRAKKLGRIFPKKENVPVCYPKTFRLEKQEKKYKDPFKQAEYVYSLVQIKE
jgi:hypothetical protein